jgi:hypothetical protein
MRIDWHKTVDFIRKDWHSNPLRLSLEVFNWVMNFVIAMTFTVSMPNVPFLVVYPMFFLCLSISMYSALSRGSFGLFMTSLTIFVIDLVGYYRLLMLQ